MKHILIPIDLSDGSRAAIAAADELATTFGARLTLLHVAQADVGFVVNDMDVDTTMGRYVGDDPEVRRRVLDDSRADVDAFLKGLPEIEAPYDVQVSLGEPTAEVISAIEPVGADMIVMSTHGRRGLKRFFLGSTAEQVVRLSPVPVLTVKPEGLEA